MINEVHIEGAVTRTWRYQAVQFARVACRLEEGRQPGAANGRRSEYVTLRFEPPVLSMAASTLKAGVLVRASGYLTSRDYDLTLRTFARGAVGDDEALARLQQMIDEVGGHRIAKPHTLNEVVVERFEVQDAPPRPARSALGRGGRGERRERPVQKAEPQDEPDDPADEEEDVGV